MSLRARISKQGLLRSSAKLSGVVVLLGACGLTGCGPSLPKTYPVTGRVVQKNGRAFTGGSVTFKSVSDETIIADGEIGPDGTFSLRTKMHGLDKPGAAAGEHHVMVEDPKRNVAPDGQLRITPLLVSKTCTVEAKDNDLTIEVDVGGR
jgi:hypothetical protein